MVDSPHTDKPMVAAMMVSTASTAQGYVFDNKLPVGIAYCGYKTPSGEFTYDETVENLPIIATEEKPDLISRGLWSNTYTVWHCFGWNPDNSTAMEALSFLGGDPYWAASSGVPMRIVSGNNNDKVGSSGCSKVWISYLDAMYLEQTTIVTLTGTTAVALVDTSIARINDFHAYAGYNPVGAITIGPTTGGSISQIGAGYTRARNSMFTIPADRSLYIKSIYYSAADLDGGRATQFFLNSNHNILNGTYSTSIFWPIDAALLKDASIYVPLVVPIVIPEKTDIYVSAITVGASSGEQTQTVLTGWLEDNT